MPLTAFDDDKVLLVAPHILRMCSTVGAECVAIAKASSAIAVSLGSITKALLMLTRAVLGALLTNRRPVLPSSLQTDATVGSIQILLFRMCPPLAGPTNDGNPMPEWPQPGDMLANHSLLTMCVRCSVTPRPEAAQISSVVLRRPLKYS